MNEILEVSYSYIKGATTSGPYVDIVLRVLNRETPPIRALVDSGAAITNVPHRYFDMLRPIAAAPPLNIRAFLGDRRRVMPFYAEVVLQKDGKHWRSVSPSRGVIFGDTYCLWLGRDVLNAFIVTLDGERCTLIPK